MGKYLDFYKKCMEVGTLDSFRVPGACIGGLCSTIANDGVTEWFNPDVKGRLRGAYWGYCNTLHEYEGMNTFEERAYSFTPLRQNMILLLAAMNDEL